MVWGSEQLSVQTLGCKQEVWCVWKGVGFTKVVVGGGRLEMQPWPSQATFASLPVAAACDWQRVLQAALLRLLQGGGS